MGRNVLMMPVLPSSVSFPQHAVILKSTHIIGARDGNRCKKNLANPHVFSFFTVCLIFHHSHLFTNIAASSTIIDESRIRSCVQYLYQLMTSYSASLCSNLALKSCIVCSFQYGLLIIQYELTFFSGPDCSCERSAAVGACFFGVRSCAQFLATTHLI